MGETRGLRIPRGEAYRERREAGVKGRARTRVVYLEHARPPHSAGDTPESWRVTFPFLHIWDDGILVRDRCPLPLPNSAQPPSVTYFLLIKVPGAHALGKAGSVAWTWMDGVHLGSHQRKQPSLWNTPGLSTTRKSSPPSLCSRAVSVSVSVLVSVSVPSSHSPCGSPASSQLFLNTNRGILPKHQPKTHRT